jgi:hypothetical protein
MAAHALMAGALGLPTEPLKWVIEGLAAAGVNDLKWQDVENNMREYAADMFGKDVAEVMMRGLPHMANIDLSSRLGLDTLVGPMNEPRSADAQDLKSWAYDTITGAPGGLPLQLGAGLKDMVADGDYVRGMERLIPIKFISDSIKAYRMATEGSVSEKTGKRMMSPLSIGETISKAVGFQSARESEGFEANAAFHRRQDIQYKTQNDFKRDWADSGSGARGRVWKEIQQWNKTQPKEARLSLSDLRKYKKRTDKDLKNAKHGITARRREEHILKSIDSTYNAE